MNSIVPTYRVFIDESGEREYGEKTSFFFVYLGCVAEIRGCNSMESQVDRLKNAYFGNTEVEFKSNWFRIPKEREKRYLQPYSLTDTIFREMTRELYSLINDLPLRLIASVVDKSAMKEKYGTRAYSPSGWGYELIMERYQFFLQEQKGYGDVVVDDISGKNPRGHPYKILIKNLHRKLQQHGSTIQKIKISNVLGQPTFWHSQDSNLLQIADLCAYNTFRQFRDFSSNWETPGESGSQMYGPFKAIANKFHTGPQGLTIGFGIKKSP